MKQQRKKYVVVLAHSDGWGASSANKVVDHIHANHPDLGIYLVVSQATKNKAGNIATKLGDLKIPRELKETDMLAYFEQIDAIYDSMPPQQELMRRWQNIRQGNASELASLSSVEQAQFYFDLGRDLTRYQMAELSTFKQLAAKCCADKTVHYTSRGGPIGGEEAAEIIGQLERQYGHGPEVLLSVDTMAILPADLLNRYDCFSAHPGPLDDIRIEGMQGTLRSLANQILYDAGGLPLPASHQFGWGLAYIKGTLFMQHPELDKGPPIRVVQTPVCPGMCAYQARDEIYASLTDAMLELLPTFLNKKARKIFSPESLRRERNIGFKTTFECCRIRSRSACQMAGNSSWICRPIEAVGR